MEQISEQFKKEHAAAERSNSPMTWMIKGVNIMTALGLKGPFTGEQVKDIISEAEKRGLQIPLTPINKMTTAEIRSFTEAATAHRMHMTIPGTVKPAASKVATYSLADDLRLTILEQRQRFEFELMKEGDSWEKLEQRMKEKADPLMKVYNARNPKRK